MISLSMPCVLSIANSYLSFGFSYLLASMGLLALWSLVLACLDIRALRLKRGLRTRTLVGLFAVGDWVGITSHDVSLF